MPFDAIPTNKTITRLEEMYALLSRPGGWIKGNLSALRHSGKVGYCLLGAGRAVGFSIEETARRLDLADPDYTAQWNDFSGRRKYEVLACVKDAIDREREKLLVG